jgi:glucokinase
MDYKEQIYFDKFSSADYTYYVLAVDVGGTNTNLAVCGVHNNKPYLVFSHHYQTQKLNDLSEAINETLKVAYERYSISVGKACIAAAGPISSDRSSVRIFLKAKWDINARSILDKTMLGSVLIINDFDAVGFGINLLEEKDTAEIAHKKNYYPKGAEKGTIAVIGAGTGLGKSILKYDAQAGVYIPIASEGGHSDFPISDYFEFCLANYIRTVNNIKENASCERMCSGPAIIDIYSYLRELKMYDETGTTKLIDSAPEDKASMIANFEQRDPTCREAMKIFVRNYGKITKNFCMEVLATGGLYIAGGIAAKNISLFRNFEFIDSFESLHEMSGVVREIPIKIITDYNVSLLGSALASIIWDSYAVKR